MIFLPEDVERRIRAEGEKSYPEECCGILLGRIAEDGERRIKDILPVHNADRAEERHHRFRIEPDEFLRVEKEARLRGLDVVGFYHSHPDHPNVPSEHDREQALPFYSYLILSVEKGVAARISFWELSSDRALFYEKKWGHAPRNDTTERSTTAWRLQS